MTVASICAKTCGAPLFIHVVGATLLVGGLATAIILAVAALRHPEKAALLHRVAFATTLIVVWPGFVATLVGGHWTLSREHLSQNKPPGWALVGIAVTDIGVLVVIALTLLVWLSQRRPRLGRAFAVLAALYLAALFVAVWAMSAKPGS